MPTPNYSDHAVLRAALITKLKSSGLGADHVKVLGFTCHAKAPIELPLQLAGFKIPYYDLSGKETQFFRFRYFPGQQNNNGFRALVQNQLKELRYAQPPNTGTHLYLPPTANWGQISQDVAVPLGITEGELKAACACEQGMPFLGLGGVWSFKDKDTFLNKEFLQFKWQGRVVNIVFDSDANTNPQIVQAQNRLAKELLNLGAVPYICKMPSVANLEKTGLDDYIVRYGAEKFAKVVLNKNAELFTNAEELFKLNEEVVYVEDPGLVLRLDTMQRLSARGFVDHAYATRRIITITPSDKGDKRTEKSAPAEWIKWPSRATVKRVTYQPGGERILPSGELNTWTGWACASHRDHVRPWLEYLQVLFGADVATLRWFQQWLAYPLQFPGTKLYTAVLLWSVKQGTGKSTIGYIMERIYGKNFAEINNASLHSNYNSWIVDKQFIMGDEVLSRDGRRDAADRIKSMITQKQVRVNMKYVPDYVVPDCANYFFTSNHPDAFFLEDADRRFMVHEVKADPKPATWFSGYLLKWLDEQGGIQALFWYLMHLDLTGFNPTGHAPYTASKQEMVLSGKSDIALWCDTLKTDPDQVLRMGDAVIQRSMFTSTELMRMFDPAGLQRFFTAAIMGRELSKAEIFRVHDGRPVRTKTWGMQRLWLVRNVEKLSKKHPKDLVEMFDAERELPEAKSKKRKF